MKSGFHNNSASAQWGYLHRFSLNLRVVVSTWARQFPEIQPQLSPNFKPLAVRRRTIHYRLPSDTPGNPRLDFVLPITPNGDHLRQFERTGRIAPGCWSPHGSRTWESLRCLLRIAVRKQCSLRRNAASRSHSNKAHHPSPLCDAGGAEIAADSRGPSESCIDCPRKRGRDLASGGGKRNAQSYYG